MMEPRTVSELRASTLEIDDEAPLRHGLKLGSDLPNFKMDDERVKKALGLIATARETVMVRSAELATLIVEGGEMDVDIRPFFYAPDDHQLADVAESIIYSASVANGRPALMRKFDGTHSATFPEGSRLVVPTSNTNGYSVDAAMPEWAIAEFLYHISLGLFQFTEIAVAQKAQKRINAFARSWGPAMEALREWDNLRPKKQAPNTR